MSFAAGPAEGSSPSACRRAPGRFAPCAPPAAPRRVCAPRAAGVLFSVPSPVLLDSLSRCPKVEPVGGRPALSPRMSPACDGCGARPPPKQRPTRDADTADRRATQAFASPWAAPTVSPPFYPRSGARPQRPPLFPAATRARAPALHLAPCGVHEHPHHTPRLHAPPPPALIRARVSPASPAPREPAAWPHSSWQRVQGRTPCAPCSLRAVGCGLAGGSARA